MKSAKNLSFKPFGKQALLIEWEAVIDKNINRDIIQFQSLIKEIEGEKIEDLIVGYHSLLVKYKFEIHDFPAKVKALKQVYQANTKESAEENYLWEIPACYELEFAIDLEELTEKLELSINEIIKIHSQTTYTVYFIGFLPGFMYLGGLDKRIHCNRKATPRLKVPKGALAIGGSQTGVYPQESAGGWNIIGNSPISFFNVNKEKPCFVSAGDEICFVPVTKTEYINIQLQVDAGIYLPTKKLIS